MNILKQLFNVQFLEGGGGCGGDDLVNERQCHAWKVPGSYSETETGE